MVPIAKASEIFFIVPVGSWFLSLFVSRCWRFFNLGVFTFGDELQIQPWWRITARAVDPELRKTFVHVVILQYDRPRGLKVPIFVVDADFVSSLIPEVFVALHLAFDSERASSGVDDRVLDRGGFFPNHSEFNESGLFCSKACGKEPLSLKPGHKFVWPFGGILPVATESETVAALLVEIQF